MAPNLSLFQRGKDTGVSSAHGENFNLNFKGEGDKIRITGDQPQGGMPVLERWCTSEVLLSDFLVDVGDGDP